jgi:hypothetical protein
MALRKSLALFKQSKSDFDSDLPMGDLAIGYGSAGFDDFKPTHVMYGL